MISRVAPVLAETGVSSPRSDKVNSSPNTFGGRNDPGYRTRQRVAPFGNGSGLYSSPMDWTVRLWGTLGTKHPGNPLSHTYISGLVHCVFSTKNRRNLITAEIQSDLWSFIGGIARKNGFKALMVGGLSGVPAGRACQASLRGLAHSAPIFPAVAGRAFTSSRFG